MNQLALENQRLEEENALLSKSNEQFQGLTNVSARQKFVIFKLSL